MLRPRPAPPPLAAAACALLLVAAPSQSGCALFSKDAAVSDYGQNARDSYEKGSAELSRENWLEALKLFQFTRAKYGFSKWATLAQLGVADANFGRQKYAEAIDEYRDF